MKQLKPFDSGHPGVESLVLFWGSQVLDKLLARCYGSTAAGLQGVQAAVGATVQGLSQGGRSCKVLKAIVGTVVPGV